MPFFHVKHEEHNGHVLMQSGINPGFVGPQKLYNLGSPLSEKEYKRTLLWKFYRNTSTTQTH